MIVCEVISRGCLPSSAGIITVTRGAAVRGVRILADAVVWVQPAGAGK